MRVLYVDDDRVNAILFTEACRIAGGLDVETAGSGAEALDLVNRWVPDLLVLDLHLPDTDGPSLLAALRQALGERELPAILCTADDVERVETSARAAGFSRCWTKPLDARFIASELAPAHCATSA